jgi:hypothetical protein
MAAAEALSPESPRLLALQRRVADAGRAGVEYSVLV